jgi:hypothetical protein
MRQWLPIWSLKTSKTSNRRKRKMENANTRIVVKDARFAYVHLLEPRAAAEGAEAKYSVTLIIPKTDEAGIAAIKAAMKAAVSKKFGDKPPKGLRNPLRDGDETDGESGEHMKGDEFWGNWYLSASSKKPVRALAGKARLPATDEHLQSGNYGAAELNFYGYDAAGNRGVAAGLNGVWITRKGEPLGSGATDWGVIEAEDFATPATAATASMSSDDVF